MYCASCASGNQAEFVAEINIHFRGLSNVDKPGVLVFPKLVVCMDCGFSRFKTPEPELALLVAGVSKSENLRREGNLDYVAPRRRAVV
jgi:hypothetical protein